MGAPFVIGPNQAEPQLRGWRVAGFTNHHLASLDQQPILPEWAEVQALRRPLDKVRSTGKALCASW